MICQGHREQKQGMSIESSDISSKLFNSRDTHLDEDQILESITKLRVEFNRIESTTGPSKRSACIRNEIKRLGRQLVYCKNQAKERTDQVSQDNP
jgi:hypothetical protein